MRELIELGRTDGLVPLRESSLYVEQRGEFLQVPKEAIPRGTRESSCCLLLSPLMMLSLITRIEP